jgi:hypothetical protein
LYLGSIPNILPQSDPVLAAENGGSDEEVIISGT